MTKHLFKATILAIAIVALSAAPALAYKESSSSTNPSSTPAYACPSCHSLESGASSPTVAPRTTPATWTWDTEAGTNVGTRKGPHGGYTPGTQKCQTCHMVHGASGFGAALLPEATIAATCYTCHDGTGGGGVYGVIKQRTGFDPTETSATAVGGTSGGVHRVEGMPGMNSKATVPGGAVGGGSIATTFTGSSGAMTCTDCHSPHNSRTVKPFVGDRLRSANDTTSGLIKTNRLLRQRPTSSVTTVTEYGSDWCETCHKGTRTGSGHTHSVADTVSAPGWNYNHIAKVNGFNSSVMTSGSLGGDNFGYVMPQDAGGARPAGSQPAPICQQCHEDQRTVGDQSVVNGDPMQSIYPSEGFNPSLDGTSATGNPRFQNFPHETMVDGMLIERRDDICLNCHTIDPGPWQ